MIKLSQFSREEWMPLAEDMHKAVFGTIKSCEDKFDYVIAITDDDIPFGYITVMEIDADKVYWQFGGVFPIYQGSIKSWKAYRMAIDMTKKRYKRINTCIENTNHTMLRFALSAGFFINGIRVSNGETLVQFTLDLETWNLGG